MYFLSTFRHTCIRDPMHNLYNDNLPLVLEQPYHQNGCERSDGLTCEKTFAQGYYASTRDTLGND